MYLYFGIVKKYLPEKGFGFLTHPILLGPSKDVFFHINKVKTSCKDVAKKLSLYEMDEKVCFWYVADTSHKGEQLSRVLKATDVFELQHDNPIRYIRKIELVWRRIGEPLPFWSSEATIGLLGLNGEERLRSERSSLIQKRNEKQEIRRLEREKLSKIKEEQLKIYIEKIKLNNEERAEETKKYEEEQQRREASKAIQLKIEEEEFELLVAEIEPKKFSMSGQVSNYIVKNRLGDKYKNISGVLEMEKNGSLWKFNGGFPPRIYARLCNRLDLDNKRTGSKVVGFTSFKDLQ